MEKISLMVNGLPGNVLTTIAKHLILDARFEVLPYSLTGPQITETDLLISGKIFSLIKPEERDRAIHKIKKDHNPFITIDFTHPTAVNDNAEFYSANSLPFIMGTTGGDRKRLEETVISSDIPAIIAPNMAKQIVGIQAMMEYASNTFPGLFKGYSLKLSESHQVGKADTSGTAKDMIGYFNKFGIDFTVNDVTMERNPDNQLNIWKIPEDHLSGHAWHTYDLTSGDSTSFFSIKHNINGRDIYADGTKDAALYLYRKIKEGTAGRVFSMIDVLKDS